MAIKLQIPGPRDFLQLNEDQIRSKRADIRNKLETLSVTSEKFPVNVDALFCSSICQIIQQLQIMKVCLPLVFIIYIQDDPEKLYISDF